MVTGDRFQNDEPTLPIKYSEEIAERLTPASSIAEPVLGPNTYIRAEKWRINRVFYFLSFTSVVCLGTLMLSPQPAIEVAVVSIWSGAVALSRYLLSSAYNGTGRKNKKK